MATITIDGIPEDVFAKLQAGADAADQPVEEYVLARIARLTEKPTVADYNALLAARGQVADLPVGDITVAIRRARDAGEEYFTDDFYDPDEESEIFIVDPKAPLLD